MIATDILKGDLSVRATEHLVAQWQKSAPARSPTNPAPRDMHVADLETRLQQRFGTKVQLRYRQGKGAVTIHFFNDEDLGRILDIFSVKVD